MEFKQIQKEVIENAKNYGEYFGIDIDEEFALLKLYEEVGEFTQAVLIHRKKSRPEKHLPEQKSKQELAKELADVMGRLIVNAHLFDIDLEEALNEKWLSKDKKWFK